MSYCIYKLVRANNKGGASSTYKINRDEEWRMIKVMEGEYDELFLELRKLTLTDPEWKRWNYKPEVMDSFIKNPMTIHRRMYHLVLSDGLNELRKQIQARLIEDGIEILN